MSIFNYFTKKTIDNNIKNKEKEYGLEELNKMIINNDESIEGLTIIENLFNKEYHDYLWDCINKEEFDDKTLSRRTQHYGYKYNYKSRSLKDEDIAPPFPKWATELILKLIEKDIIKEIPKQLIVNEYKDNQGISAHTDAKIFGNLIFSISLGSKCKMIFKRKKIDQNNSGDSKNSKGDQYEKIEKELLPNSILLMKDDSRYKWTHEIPKLKKGQHRISLTFRYLSESIEKKNLESKKVKYSPY